MAAGNRFLYVHLKDDEAKPEQTPYISGYLDSVARAVSAADGVDSTTGQDYSELIDVPRVQWISANVGTLQSF